MSIDNKLQFFFKPKHAFCMYLHAKVKNILKNYLKGARKDFKRFYTPLDLTNAPASIFNGKKVIDYACASEV